MTVKEYLEQVENLDRQKKSIREQLYELDTERKSVSSVLTKAKVQTSLRPGKLADLTAAFVDLQDVYIIHITRLLRLKYDIQSMIDTLEDSNQQLVLMERYINLKRWLDVAEDNSYSLSSVYRFHSDALKALQKKFSDRFEV